MSRDRRLYLDDILEAICRIREYTRAQDERAFLADQKTQDAVVFSTDSALRSGIRLL